MASAMRDSSPPEATLATGRGVLPAWPATRKLHGFQAVGLRRACRHERDLETAALHAQPLHRLRDGLGQLGRGLLARGAEAPGFGPVGALGAGTVFSSASRSAAASSAASSSFHYASSAGSSAGGRL